MNTNLFGTTFNVINENLTEAVETARVAQKSGDFMGWKALQPRIANLRIALKAFMQLLETKACEPSSFLWEGEYRTEGEKVVAGDPGASIKAVIAALGTANYAAHSRIRASRSQALQDDGKAVFDTTALIGSRMDQRFDAVWANAMGDSGEDLEVDETAMTSEEAKHNAAVVYGYLLHLARFTNAKGGTYGGWLRGFTTNAGELVTPALPLPEWGARMFERTNDPQFAPYKAEPGTYELPDLFVDDAGAQRDAQGFTHYVKEQFFAWLHEPTPLSPEQQARSQSPWSYLETRHERIIARVGSAQLEKLLLALGAGEVWTAQQRAASLLLIVCSPRFAFERDAFLASPEWQKHLLHGEMAELSEMLVEAKERNAYSALRDEIAALKAGVQAMQGQVAEANKPAPGSVVELELDKNGDTRIVGIHGKSGIPTYAHR